MKLRSFDCGYFKLDGGAMFGVVPKKIWEKLIPADENNLCNWIMRCLLVESGNRKILIDCGMGTKQDPKFFSHYAPSGNISVDSTLQEMHLSKADITDVFLTHLHFDHCGGAVEIDAQGKLIPAFPNATYWSNEKHWQWAEFPNAREKASFLNENFLPLTEHGVVKFLQEGEPLLPGFETIW
ncbi:MAG: MBL fold metallo-hydrolase, partial [Chitinophagales bacterium]